MDLSIFTAGVVVMVTVFLGWLRVKLVKKCTLRTWGKTLLVTAHPDDECMFFAPTILALTNTKSEVFLLCLSEGNYYGEGSVRRRELLDSTAILGIPPSHLRLVDDSRLPDGLEVEWNEDVIGEYVLAAVKEHAIKQVITFDHHGVSGHPNHKAVSKAVMKLFQQGMLQGAGVKVTMLLETTNIVRKYISWLDIVWSLSFSTYYAYANFTAYLQARKAMQAHTSQYVWFRRLYIIFSRYLVLNTFQRL